MKFLAWIAAATLTTSALADTPATTRAAVPTTQPAAAAKIAAPARGIGVRAFNTNAQRDAQRQFVKNMTDGGAFRIEDLARFSVAEGRLQIEWVADKIPNGQPRRVKIHGSDATWMVQRSVSGPNAFCNITRYDFDAADDDVWMTQISYQQGVNFLTLYAQGGDTAEVTRLIYSQQSVAVTINLTGYENNRPRQLLAANAPDLFRLRNDHPDAVCRHLLPLLRKITLQPILRPGAGDVYRVFADIPADPNVTARLAALLPNLDAADPDARDRANAQLRALGPAAALAALRYDRELLLPEQANRLAAFVATHSRVTIDDPAQATADPGFLLDCFEDDDVAVRAAAKSALEKVLNRPVEFDVNASPEKRAATADALRIKLAGERKPDAEPKPPAPEGAEQFPLLEKRIVR